MATQLANSAKPRRSLLDTMLVTGAGGSIGSALVSRLGSDGEFGFLAATDIGELDVRDRAVTLDFIQSFGPTLIYHLAGSKSAPAGEADPFGVADTNVNGTRHVLEAARKVDAKVITVSTCKACDPETVYGASKLIAERMTLNEGGWVARLYNVRESSGNVFEIWRAIPEAEPLPVTACRRYFITLDAAIDLLVALPDLPPGRYTTNPGRRFDMIQVAESLYPDRTYKKIPSRRGDRLAEPRHAACEKLISLNDGIERIFSAHDEWGET